MRYKIVLVLSLLLCFILPSDIAENPQPLNIPKTEEKSVEVANIALQEVVKEESVKDLITRLAKEQNFDVKTAIRIGDCESKLGLYDYSLSGSSAKGIYQFIDSTWENYCEGDVLNHTDNINCFLKLYDKNKNWWSCS